MNGVVYDFSVDYNTIEKEDVLNICDYSIKKNNVK